MTETAMPQPAPVSNARKGEVGIPLELDKEVIVLPGWDCICLVWRWQQPSGIDGEMQNWENRYGFKRAEWDKLVEVGTAMFANCRGLQEATPAAEEPAVAPPPEGAVLSDKALLMLLLELESATMRMHDPSAKMRDIAVKSAQEAREKIIAHDAALRAQVKQANEERNAALEHVRTCTWRSHQPSNLECAYESQFENLVKTQAQLATAEGERAALLHTARELLGWSECPEGQIADYADRSDPLLAQGLALLGGEG